MWAGVAVSFCFVLFRLYVRLRIFRRCHVEDPFVLAAWLMNLANAVIWQRNADQLYSIIAVGGEQVSKPPPQFPSHFSTKLHSALASSILYYTALWSIKISFLLFFRTLGSDIRRHKVLWYCVLAYTIASYIVCIGTIDYGCLVRSEDLGRQPLSL